MNYADWFAQRMQPVREAVSYRGLFTAGWFSVREKHCSWLEIYDRLRASEQAASLQGCLRHKLLIQYKVIFLRFEELVIA